MDTSWRYQLGTGLSSGYYVGNELGAIIRAVAWAAKWGMDSFLTGVCGLAAATILTLDIAITT